MPHIAVIGAGITGITTAYKLLDRGFSVTVIERNHYAAMETSFANGGQLSASNAEVWNAWGTVFKGLKWLLRKDAPLAMNLTPSWHKYSWLAEFVAAIPQHDRNTIATAKLAMLSREHLLDMAERAGIDFDMQRRGIVHVYDDWAEFEAGRWATKLLAEAGLERTELSPDEVRAHAPTMHGDFVGGFMTASDFTGDIHAFTNQLAEDARRRGATLRFGVGLRDAKVLPDGVRIETLSVSGTPDAEIYDGVVVCAGCGSRDIAARLGDRVNIYPVKGYSITVNMTDTASQQAAPYVSLLDERAKVVTSRLGDGRFRIAGTAEFNGYNRDIREDRIRPLVAWCRQRFPGVDTRDVTPWAGLRPMMPNMMPKVGPGRRARVFYNTGHGHLGWTLSAATAEMVAESVAQQMHGPRPVRAGLPAGLLPQGA